MKTVERNTERYFILGVRGIYQRWSDHDNTELTPPVPFEGYVQSVDWGYSIGEKPEHAHRFEKPATEPWPSKSFGPWWYQVKEQFWIEVEVATLIKRKVLEWPTT